MTGHPQAAPARPVNGHPVTIPVMLPLSGHGPSSPWPPQQPDGRGTAPEPSPPAGSAAAPVTPSSSPARQRLRLPSLRRPDGDKVIDWATAATVTAVATFAAIVSYSHIYALALAHAENGIEARLLPLSVDGVIAEASFVMLSAVRRRLPPSPLARFMLWLGIAATVAANVAFGLPPQWIGPVANAVIGALLSAWPAGAFIGSVEMAIRHVRDSRAAATVRPGDAVSDPVMTPSPQEPEPAAVPSPGSPPAPAAPVTPHPERPSRKPVTRPAKAPAKATLPAKGTPSSDGKITAALTADPSLADASIPVMAKAAGVSESTVERYRKRLRDAAAGEGRE